MPQTIDYAALAEQARKSTPVVDYAALAEQARQGDQQPDFRTTNARDAQGRPVVNGALDEAKRLGGIYLQNVLPSTTPADYVNGPIYAAQHPMDSMGLILKALWDAHVAQAQKTAESAKGVLSEPTLGGKLGAASETLGHGMATMLPLVGPAAANAGERGASGDVGGMLAATAGILTPLVGPHVSDAVGRVTQPVRENIADQLKASAVTGIEKAINPTRVDTKVRTARIAPEMLERRVSARSLPKLEEMAAEKSAAAGAEVDAALAPHAQTTVMTKPILAELEKAKQDYMGTTTTGGSVVNDPARVKAIQRIQDTVAAYGDEISVESMVKFRRNLDQVVEAGKGFTTPKASVKAWAAREGRTALRDQLTAAVPDLDKVNAEYSFWQNLEDVAHATNQRRTGQNGSLLTTIAGGAGAVAGEMIAPGSGLAGKGVSALLGAKGAASLKRLIDSPGYRMWSSVQKAKLADALANRNASLAKGLIASGLDAAGTTSRATGRLRSGQQVAQTEPTDPTETPQSLARGSRP